MDLIGHRLGNYDILEEIGRGGMAVVYRAYQRSLNRHVAIKVLAPQLSFDQQFVERFLREAHAAAKLRHPNIVVIHDVGQQEGIYFLVMELLEGRTLKQLIEQKGSLSPQRAARIVEQVASALDYAHQQGFIHRDIKPANIFVGTEDRTTLADFGIAKAASETQHLTRTGMLIGTPEYMSPEQAEGGRVDYRTDLYALGVVLYQMLAGRVPFQSTTPHATLHAVIYEPPPPIRQLRPDLSPAVEAVVMKSIAKQPAQRYQGGSELVAALKSSMKGQTTVAIAAPLPQPTAPPSPAPAAPTRRRSLVVWIVAALAAVLVLLLVALLLVFNSDTGGQDSTPGTTVIAVHETAAGTASGTATGALPIREPTSTATSLATGITAHTPTSLPPSATPISHTSTPPVATDTPVLPTHTPPPPVQPARFGRLAFSSNRDGNAEIYVVELDGGNLVRLTQNNASDWLPDWSPDGTKIAFTSHRTGSYDLWAMRPNGSAQTSMVATGAWDDYARWAPDSQRLSLSTTAETQGVPNSEVFVRRSNGSLQQVTHSTAEDQWADWSPDGRLVFTEGYKDSSDWDIYVVNADGSGRTTWLDDANCDVQPTWSPDGNWIAFLRITNDTNANGRIDFEDAGSVWVGRASGGGVRQTTSGVWAMTPAWSPDSQWIAFAQVRDSNSNGRSDENDAVDIWAVPLSGGDMVPLVQSPHRDGNPAWTW